MELEIDERKDMEKRYSDTAWRQRKHSDKTIF
jgi:hypothetical protein